MDNRLLFSNNVNLKWFKFSKTGKESKFVLMYAIAWKINEKIRENSGKQPRTPKIEQKSQKSERTPILYSGVHVVL